jgi:hypothetical protein
VAGELIINALANNPPKMIKIAGKSRYLEIFKNSK